MWLRCACVAYRLATRLRIPDHYVNGVFHKRARQSDRVVKRRKRCVRSNESRNVYGYQSYYALRSVLGSQNGAAARVLLAVGSHFVSYVYDYT